MLTQSMPVDRLLTEPPETDPSSEHALNGAGYPHATVMLHRATNTCVVTIDRDHLAELVATVAAVDGRDLDHLAELVATVAAVDGRDLDDAREEGHDDGVRDATKALTKALDALTILDEHGNPVSADAIASRVHYEAA